MQPDLSRSAALYERALKVLPGGVSRNAILRAGGPTYVEYGKGCRVTDLDGVTRIDFSNNMASLIHGHACPEIIDAVTEQMTRGTAFMMGTEIEVRYAEHLCSRNASFEKMRFMNSGTEAIMVALKAARAFTGRPKIAKAEGAYHGVYDYAEVSQGSTRRPGAASTIRAAFRWCTAHPSPRSRTSLSFRSTTSSARWQSWTSTPGTSRAY